MCRDFLYATKRMMALLTAVLVCVNLIGCTGNDKLGSVISPNTTVIYPDTTDAEPLTIGYTFWDLDFDGFMNDQANQIKLVADALNVNLIFNPDTTDFSADSVVRAAEYFAKQNVDGMIVINFSDESLLDISEICETNQIPFIQATRTIGDTEVADVVESNPYYVGRMHESEYAAAYEIGRRIIDNGSKRFIMLSAEHGDVAYEARAQGFRDACEEPDVDIVEEIWDLADDEITKETTIRLLKSHPDVDGIFSVRGGFFPYIVAAENEMGLTDYVPIGGFDFDKSLGKYIDSGAVTAVAGGHHADASLSLITLINSIRGAYDESVYPIDINYNMMIIDSPKEFEDYKSWCLGYDEDFDNRQILNANDARGLCVDYNPDTTLNDITAFAEYMSLQSVKNRHASFID